MTLIPYPLKDILLIVAVTLFLYYSYVIMRYYRKEFFRFVKGNPKVHQQDPESKKKMPALAQDPIQAPTTFHDEQDNEYLLTEQLISRIRDAFASVVESGAGVQDLPVRLHLLLMEYFDLSDILQAGVTELILSEYKENGLTIPGRGEVESWWKRMPG